MGYQKGIMITFSTKSTSSLRDCPASDGLSAKDDRPGSTCKTELRRHGHRESLQFPGSRGRICLIFVW